MDLQGIEKRMSGGSGDKMDELHADRLEALCNLAFLMRSDIASRERLEMYLQMMDGVLAGMTADERSKYERRMEMDRAG